MISSNCTFSSKNEDLENRLISIVKEVANPDMIYVLGVVRNNRIIESIFRNNIYQSQTDLSYFLFVLLRQDPDTTLVKIQERIEQQCESVASTTCLVLETQTFEQWILEGHGFAHLIYSIDPVYKVETICLGPIGLKKSDKSVKEQHYWDACNKYQEFMAGAELFKIRKQYKFSMFMLHQAMEHVLSGVLKIGMGYYCCTHSIERLIRYAGFILGEIHEIFPRNNETEKRLFKLLQRAYIESRYGTDYVVNFKDLDAVFSKVERVNQIVKDWVRGSNNSGKGFD